MNQIRYFLDSGPDSVLFGPFFRGRSELVQRPAPTCGSDSARLRPVQRRFRTVQVQDSPLGQGDHLKTRTGITVGEDGGGGADELSAPPLTVSSA